jgi:hypothetical protein
MVALPVGGIRDDLDGTGSYLLHCERSAGRYLFDALLRAGAGLSIMVDGFARYEPSGRGKAGLKNGPNGQTRGTGPGTAGARARRRGSRELSELPGRHGSRGRPTW